jgi:hypothetical protein
VGEPALDRGLQALPGGMLACGEDLAALRLGKLPVGISRKGQGLDILRAVQISGLREGRGLGKVQPGSAVGGEDPIGLAVLGEHFRRAVQGHVVESPAFDPQPLGQRLHPLLGRLPERIGIAVEIQ